MNKTVAVANFFIGRGIAEEVIDSCPPKIMTLCYFAHGWFLGITGKPMLDTRFVATSTGPEQPELARMLRPHGNDRITDLLRVVTPDPAVPGRSKRAAPVIPPGSPLQVILKKVWAGLGRVGAYTLNDLMCAPYSPWASVWYGSEERPLRGLPIDDEVLRAWFEKRRIQSGGKMEISVDAIKQSKYERYAGGRGDED